MQTITIVLRDKESKCGDTAKHVYSYFSSIIPRVGEIVEVKRHPPYEVERVIHVIDNGVVSVILEVKSVQD